VIFGPGASGILAADLQRASHLLKRESDGLRERGYSGFSP
jgi:hypothetical protein